MADLIVVDDDVALSGMLADYLSIAGHEVRLAADAGALDSQTSEDIMRLLADLNVQGMTVIIVTHEHDVAAWAKRRIVFKDGQVIEDRAQVPQRPAPVEAGA